MRSALVAVAIVVGGVCLAGPACASEGSTSVGYPVICIQVVVGGNPLGPEVCLPVPF
jgi:hypothetical protein